MATVTDFQVARLGYLAFGTPKLEDSVDFYRRSVRLTVSERKEKTVFLTGDNHHHWVRLQEDAPAGLLRIGLEAVSEEALEQVKADLKDRGVAYQENASTIADDRIDNSIRFTDPGGYEIELYTVMAALGESPDKTGANFVRFLHALWNVADVQPSWNFYHDVLGFRASDWVGTSSVFAHCADRYHHGIGLSGGRGGTPTFHHFCMLVESIDDVMRYRENAIRNGVTISSDIHKNSPSGSIAVYLQDPILGHSVEYCTNHRQCDDDNVARIFPTLNTFNIWSQPYPELGEDVTLAKAQP